MWKFISSLVLLGLFLINAYIIFYTMGLKTYKVENELPSFYKYVLLEGKIKKDFEDLKGQNVLVEKGSNRVVKVQNYIVTGDTVADGFLLKDGIENRIAFQGEKLSTLMRRHENVDSITLEKFGEIQLQEFITLTGKNLINLIDTWSGETMIQGEYPEIF